MDLQAVSKFNKKYLTAFVRLFLHVRSKLPKSVVNASAKGNGEWSRNPMKAIKEALEASLPQFSHSSAIIDFQLR